LLMGFDTLDTMPVPCGSQTSLSPIPKVIYQCWKTKNLPGQWETQWNKTLAANLGWRRIVITDHEMDHIVHNEWREEADVVWAYEQTNWIVAKVDLFRYLLLYKHGGVYVDADDYLTGTLDALIGNDSAVLSYLPNELSQACIMYCKGHPFLRAVIDEVVRNIRFNMWPDYVGKMTGPGAHAAAVSKLHEYYFGKEFPSPPSDAVAFQTTCLQYRLTTLRFGGCVKHFPSKTDLLYKSNNLTYYQKMPASKHLRKGGQIAGFLKTLQSNPRWAIGHFNLKWFA